MFVLTLHMITLLKFGSCRVSHGGTAKTVIPSYAVCNMMLEAVHRFGSAHCLYRASESPTAPVSGARIQGIPFTYFLYLKTNPGSLIVCRYLAPVMPCVLITEAKLSAFQE